LARQNSIERAAATGALNKGEIVKNHQGRAVFALAMALAASLAIYPQVLLAASPTVTSFSPTSGPIGSKVVIKGTNLSSPTAVTFDGINASSFTGNSATQVTATVAATGTGPVSVKTSGGTATSGAAFTVTPSLQLSQNTGYPTVNFTVTAAGFGPYSSVDVYFDTMDIALAASNSLGVISIVVQVPASGQPGGHWVTLDARSSHLAVQKAFTVNTNWPMLGFGPADAGVNPFENTLSPSNVSQVGMAWTEPSGGYGNPSPFIEYNGTIFVGDVNGVARAYSSTGTLLWSATEPADFQFGSPASNGGLVFFGTNIPGTSVYAFENNCRSDGGVCAPRWTSDLGFGITASPTLRQGKLYVPAADGNIYPLDPVTGTVGTPFFALSNTEGAITTPVTFATDGTFYYANNNYLQFKSPAGSAANISQSGRISPITINAGRAYFTTDDGQAHKFGGWSAATSGTGCAPAPVVAYNRVYAGGCTSITAFEASTGTVEWSATTFAPVIGMSEANGVLYVCFAYFGGYGGLAAYDALYGGLLWSGPACSSTPIIANGYLYGASGSLSAYTLPQFNPASVEARPQLTELKPDFRLAAQRTEE
jgi:hypothetical protein